MSRTTRPFYRGETIDLVAPTLELAQTSSWSDWLNSQKTNEFTSHGVVVNTVEDQVEFYRNLKASGRFALLIVNKDDSTPVGVVSLSGIDHRQRTAGIAIIMDSSPDSPVSPFAGLEAMALMTQHAFEVMGLRRVEAGQAYPGLSRWNRLLEVLGYRAEGIKRQAFARGRVVSDVVLLSCLERDYLALLDRRGGSLWPSGDVIRDAIRALPRRAFAEVIDDAIRSLERDYFAEEEPLT